MFMENKPINFTKYNFPIYFKQHNIISYIASIYIVCIACICIA